MRYNIDMVYWRNQMLPWPTQEQFNIAIYSAGNKEYGYGSDANAIIYVECEKRPKDMPENGIRWILS